jgi:UvrB/uvrC motif
MLTRYGEMSETIETLRQRMESAALALNFEEAKHCRDQIAIMRGGATSDEADHADFTGLDRQKPGAMGLGTSQQRLTPPAGWKRPTKPDPMTAGRSSRSRHHKS